MAGGRRSRSRSNPGGSRDRSCHRSRSRSRSRSSSPVRLFALVKWLTGRHKGTFSHDVNTSWIREFSPNGPFDDAGYAIEWRVGNMPRHGWHLFDGLVLDVSDDPQYLKRKEAELLAEQPQGQQPHQSGSLSTPQRQQSHQNGLGHQPAHQNGSLSTPQRQQSNPPAANNDLIQALLGALQQRPHPQSCAMAANQAAGTVAGSNDAPEQEGRIGKQLRVPRSCYLQAKAARSPSSMTMYLTRAAFSKRRLIKSSYAGQKRKRSDGQVVKKPGLKRFQLMRDIQDFVLTRFSVTQSSFGAAVNACTGEKAKERPEIEYEVEMSSEEEENEDS